jgi:DNA-binding transcriptional LysR family regulator
VTQPFDLDVSLARVQQSQRMNLLSAEAFVTVVNLGSLRKAAERLGTSSATVSRRLSQLEAELGVRLVERTTRSLRVTDLGHAFHARCARGLEAIEEAHDLVAARQERVAGTVRLSTAPTLGPLLLGVIAAVRAAHPEIQVLLVETERHLDLHHDDVDLVVRVGAVSDERLVARRLGAYPHVLVASKEYVARAGAPATPEDLESHAIVAFGGKRRFSGWELVPVHGGENVRVSVRPGLSTNDYTTLTHAVRRGMGIGELPAVLAGERASLVRILPQWTLREVPLHLIFPADRLLSRAVRAVIDGIVAQVPGEVRRFSTS